MSNPSPFWYRTSSGPDLVRVPAKKHTRGCRLTLSFELQYSDHWHLYTRLKECSCLVRAEEEGITNRALYKSAPFSCFALIHSNRELANHLTSQPGLHFIHAIQRSFLIISSPADSHDGILQELIIGCTGSSPLRRSRAHRQRRPSLYRVLHEDMPQRGARRLVRHGEEGRRGTDGTRRAPPLLPRLLRQRTAQFYIYSYTDYSFCSMLADFIQHYTKPIMFDRDVMPPFSLMRRPSPRARRMPSQTHPSPASR
jgi:hypothetical protein